MRSDRHAHRRRSRQPSAALAAGPGAVVTIGAFDGVHLGHQAVLRLVRELADARGLDAACSRSTAIRPRSCAPSRRRSSSPTLDQKLELLDGDRRRRRMRRAARSTRRAARSRPRTSSRRCSPSALGARLVVVGADFHFGYRRHGDVPLLQRMGAELGFEVIGLGLVAARRASRRDVPYSSTRVRDAARGGRRREARPRLSAGRTRCAASVEHGDARGPRARLPDRQRRGARARSACPPTASTPARSPAPTASSAPAAISLGRRPTFYADAGLLLLEAYVLDFDGDLYGQRVEVRFHRASPRPGALRLASTRSSSRCTRDVEATRRVVAV